jgi:hypothetical protein
VGKLLFGELIAGWHVSASPFIRLFVGPRPKTVTAACDARCPCGASILASVSFFVDVCDVPFRVSIKEQPDDSNVTHTAEPRLNKSRANQCTEFGTIKFGLDP